MQESIFISICVPVYGVEAYIEKCSRSIFEQTYSNWEAIFVDDASPDNSIRILEKVVSEYPDIQGGIHIIHHKKNRGLAAARNTGVDYAKGDFVMHVDSDDWLEPDALEVLVKRQLETKADIVSANAICHCKQGNVLLTEPDYSNSYEMTLKMVEISLNHVIWRRIIRRGLYLENGIHAEEGVDIGEDHYTMPRLSFFARSVASVNEVLYHYNRLNVNSYLNKGSRNTFNYGKYSGDRESLRLLLCFFGDRDEGIFAKVKDIQSFFFQSSLYKAVAANDFRAYHMITDDRGIAALCIPSLYSKFIFERFWLYSKKIGKMIMNRYVGI